MIPLRDHSSPLIVTESMPQLVERARRLAKPGQRRILGITGAPGAGKSTLTDVLCQTLGDHAVAVGMDGFHLANDELNRLQRRHRKGAPDTFDADGFAALLGRLRRQEQGVIYAPRFDRALEESIGSAIPVEARVPLVITEGNYLLHDEGEWAAVREHLHEVWYLDIPAELRRSRLVARRRSFGHAAEEARTWVEQVDESNARIVERARDRADLVITVTTPEVEVEAPTEG